jgi:hypothetical protein
MKLAAAAASSSHRASNSNRIRLWKTYWLFTKLSQNAAARVCHNEITPVTTQIAIIRAALSTCGRAKTKFLSIQFNKQISYHSLKQDAMNITADHLCSVANS